MGFSSRFNMFYTHTHTHSHTALEIYILRARKRYSDGHVSVCLFHRCAGISLAQFLIWALWSINLLFQHRKGEYCLTFPGALSVCLIISFLLLLAFTYFLPHFFIVVVVLVHLSYLFWLFNYWLIFFFIQSFFLSVVALKLMRLYIFYDNKMCFCSACDAEQEKKCGGLSWVEMVKYVANNQKAIQMMAILCLQCLFSEHYYVFSGRFNWISFFLSQMYNDGDFQMHAVRCGVQLQP